MQEQVLVLSLTASGKIKPTSLLCIPFTTHIELCIITD